MASIYYLTLTNYGSDLIAQSHEMASILLKSLVLGDANGIPYDPLSGIGRTHLVNQKASVLIQHIQVIEDVIRVTATIGAQIGGFNIHEIGLTDETDQLIYIGNYHGGYKSVFEEGAGGEITISIDIKGTAANKISLSVDPNINTATQAWILENYIPRDELVDNLTTEDAKKPVSANQAKLLQDNKLDKDDVLQFMPIAYPKSTPPSGYLAMMGQAISQATYPKLYKLYGANLPDMRAYTIRGLDYGRGIDVGRVVLSEQQDEIKAHTHDFSVRANGATTSTAVNDVLKAGSGGFSKTTDANGGAETRVKNIAFLYIVKAG